MTVLAGELVVLVVDGILGYALARRALSPIKHMADRAKEITADGPALRK